MIGSTAQRHGLQRTYPAISIETTRSGTASGARPCYEHRRAP